MQTEMLDTVVSSNSQELFNFNATHNGEACIESIRPEDRGTERQFWFTVAMLCVIFDVAERTLRDNIEGLIEDGEVDCEISQSTVIIEDSMGRLLRLLRLQKVTTKTGSGLSNRGGDWVVPSSLLFLPRFLEDFGDESIRDNE